MKNYNTEENQKYMSHKILGERQMPKMVDFLLRTKLVKKVETAYYTYVVFSVLLVLASILIIYFNFLSVSSNAVPYEELTPAQKSEIPYQERIYLDNKNNR